MLPMGDVVWARARSLVIQSRGLRGRVFRRLAQTGEPPARPRVATPPTGALLPGASGPRYTANRTLMSEYRAPLAVTYTGT
jgi:hypothetical protein